MLQTPLSDPKLQKTYEQLKQVRSSKTVELRSTGMLRTEIVGFDGNPQQFKMRYYQVQGIFHLLAMSRMVLGDGTGLGKTLQAIGAMCYLWERNPSMKTLVVCPKSAIRQWAAEVDKFSTGVKVFVAAGDLKVRVKAYNDWAECKTPSLLVVNYHSLVRDWDHGVKKEEVEPGSKRGTQGKLGRGLVDGLTSQMPDLTVVYDECFDYHTPILLADGSTELIGRVVTKRLPVEVLSWNFETQQVETKKVTNWFRNPIRSGKRESLLKVTSRFAGSVNVTRAHKFYRLDGSATKAGELKVGSETAVLSTLPSEAQAQVIYGGLLGDSSLSHPNRALWGICFGHSSKQRQYLEFKHEVLSSMLVSEISEYQTEFQSGTQQMCRFRASGNAAVTSTLASTGLWSGGRKTITADFLNLIDPLGLAVWYGDDGSLSEHQCKDGTISRHITLNTQGYTSAENELLAGWLRWKWGVRARVRQQYNKKRQVHYFVLYLDNEATNKFLSILPGALPGVGYKFPGMGTIEVPEAAKKTSIGVVPDQVLSLKDWLPANPNVKYVYDIEVDDNHNYFANGSLVSNCTAFKNPSTKTHQTCKFLSDKSKRVWGLTATLLKNNLMEGFGIFKVIRPTTFTSKTRFMDDYCVTEMKPVKGGIKVPIVVGYKHLEHFRLTIDPFFYGRPKHMVSDELPSLTTREVICELSPAEDRKYQEALDGIMLLGDGELKDYQETKDLTSLIYAQEVVNSLYLLKFKEGDDVSDDATFEGRSAKESALVDLISEEFDDDKVIIYTRFEKMATRLQAILTKEHIKSVRITGKEDDKARKKAMDQFQDAKSKVQVIIITDAGSEAINLQMASAMIFYDSPWSWGNYVQLLGRMIRIGSPHQKVYAVHLVAERPTKKGKGRETIDQKVIAKLRNKKGYIDQIIGEAAVGALRFERSEGDIRELALSLREKG